MKEKFPNEGKNKEVEVRERIQALINEAIGARTTKKFNTSPIEAEKLITAHGFKPEDFGISKEGFNELILEHGVGVIKSLHKTFKEGEFEKLLDKATGDMDPFWKQAVASRIINPMGEDVRKIEKYLIGRFGDDDPRITEQKPLFKELNDVLIERSWRNPFEEQK
jgi:hypothetical protein